MLRQQPTNPDPQTQRKQPPTNPKKTTNKPRQTDPDRLISTGTGETDSSGGVQPKKLRQSSDLYWSNPSEILESLGVDKCGDTLQTVNEVRNVDDILPWAEHEQDHVVQVGHDVDQPLLLGAGVGVAIEDGGEPVKTRRTGGKDNRKRRKQKSGNLSRYSIRETEREKQRNSKIESENNRIDGLKQTLGDPWDTLAFDDKKRFALHFYYIHLQVKFSVKS